MSPITDQSPNDDAADQEVQPPVDDLPAPITGVDRLATIYRREGPYTSVFMTLGDTVNGRFERRLLVMVDSLRQQGASDAAIDAIEARLALPSPDDVAGIAIFAADDGTTVVDYGHEPPFHDHGVVDTLPHAAPMLEWDQRRVSHIVVSVDDHGADLALFGLDHFSRLERVDGIADEVIDRVVEVAGMLRTELLILTGDPGVTQAMADALAPKLGVDCRVVIEPVHDDVEDLVDVTVRHVNDAAARRTVALLREHRFLDDHDAAVDGRADTMHELVAGSATRLLIHDSPTDQDRAWIGDQPQQLSMTERPGFRSARLTDALIWSAVLQGVPIHIIPRTGPDGPDGDTAAIVDEAPQFTDS